MNSRCRCRLSRRLLDARRLDRSAAARRLQSYLTKAVTHRSMRWHLWTSIARRCIVVSRPVLTLLPVRGRADPLGRACFCIILLLSSSRPRLTRCVALFTQACTPMILPLLATACRLRPDRRLSMLCGRRLSPTGAPPTWTDSLWALVRRPSHPAALHRHRLPTHGNHWVTGTPLGIVVWCPLSM